MEKPWRCRRGLAFVLFFYYSKSIGLIGTRIALIDAGICDLGLDRELEHSLPVVLRKCLPNFQARDELVVASY
jgi:hypothetical protein